MLAGTEIASIVDKCLSGMERALRKRVEAVISLKGEEKGWKALVEVVERKAIPDTMDLIGRYEVKLSIDGTPLAYEQLLIRHRQDCIAVDSKENKNA